VFHFHTPRGLLRFHKRIAMGFAAFVARFNNVAQKAPQDESLTDWLAVRATLTRAMKNSRAVEIQKLIDRHGPRVADLQCLDRNGAVAGSALMWCVEKRFEAGVNTLLPHANTRIVSEKGETPLSVAARQGNMDLVLRLIPIADLSLPLHRTTPGRGDGVMGLLLSSCFGGASVFGWSSENEESTEERLEKMGRFVAALKKLPKEISSLFLLDAVHVVSWATRKRPMHVMTLAPPSMREVDLLEKSTLMDTVIRAAASVEEVGALLNERNALGFMVNASLRERFFPAWEAASLAREIAPADATNVAASVEHQPAKSLARRI